MSDLTGELLAAVVAATPELKATALKVLRGELPHTCGRPVTGPLLLRMGEGAKFLGVSRATLWRICAAGRIKKVELFVGAYRVRRSDLEDLAAGRLHKNDSELMAAKPGVEALCATMPRRSACGRSEVAPKQA